MTQKIMKWIAWSTIGVSLLIYVLACALLSGVNVGIDPEDEVQGFWCLAGGWTYVFASIAGGALSKHPLIAIWNVFVSLFLWGSNILYFWSIIDLLRAKVRKRTIWLALLAFSASLYYFLFYHPECLRLGNYLWSASYLVMLIGVVILWWNNYNNRLKIKD